MGVKSMAVVYMRKLEEEPETYDSKFTQLTKGVNLKVQERILSLIKPGDSILEVGCGPGTLAYKMSELGNSVTAIDRNPRMIRTAKKRFADVKNKLEFQVGSTDKWQIEDEAKDVIVSTFMLSELRPFEQQKFLRNAWKSLKPGSRLILAAEFKPSGFWKLIFKLKRWWYRKKIRRLRLPETFVLNWFFNYIEPIGFKLISHQKWKHGSIQALELQKVNDGTVSVPGYYTTPQRSFKGFKAQMRIYRCLFTGQRDHVPIEPGIYRSGNPNSKAPIIVTANYDYTYIKVMRALRGIDAWVLCVDSMGINVWCAARGNHFGNKEVIEAVENTDLRTISERKTLILPQLSAGGVQSPLISMEAPDFPYNILYGPVWAKHLPQYLKERPARKPAKMKLAKFTFSHRFRAGITHITLLFRMIFLWLGIAVALLFVALGWFDKLWWIGEVLLWVVLANALIAFAFPIANFTRNFKIKGTVFGILNIVVSGGLTWIFHGSLVFILWNLCFYFWIAFFSTMSFSGYTMATSPSEILAEYPSFRIINRILFISSVVLTILGFIFYNFF